MKTEKKRYLYIQNFPYPSEKAHGVYIAKSAESMSYLGWDSHIIVPHRRLTRIQRADEKEYYRISAPVSVHKVSFSGLLPPLLANVFRRNAHSLASLLFYILSLPTVVKINPEVIQTTDPEGILLFSLMKRCGWQTKVIYDIHLDQPGWIGKQVLPYVNAVIVNCGYYQQEFIHRGVRPEKILLIPNGYDPTLFTKDTSSTRLLRKRLGISQQDFVIGYVGRFETLGEEKGIRLLLKIASNLIHKIPLKILLVGGPKALADEYRQLAQTYGIVDRVVIHPAVMPHEVPAYLHLCHAGWMVYPDTPRFRHRISPMKAVEYAAAQLPIIASDLPSIKELFGGEFFYFVDPDNLSNIARILIEIYCRSEDTQQKVTSAYKQIQTWDWLHRQQRIIKVL